MKNRGGRYDIRHAGSFGTQTTCLGIKVREHSAGVFSRRPLCSSEHSDAMFVAVYDLSLSLFNKLQQHHVGRIPSN